MVGISSNKKKHLLTYSFLFLSVFLLCIGCSRQGLKAPPLDDLDRELLSKVQEKLQLLIALTETALQNTSLAGGMNYQVSSLQNEANELKNTANEIRTLKARIIKNAYIDTREGKWVITRMPKANKFTKIFNDDLSEIYAFQSATIAGTTPSKGWLEIQSTVENHLAEYDRAFNFLPFLAGLGVLVIIVAAYLIVDRSKKRAV